MLISNSKIIAGSSLLLETMSEIGRKAMIITNKPPAQNFLAVVEKSILYKI